MYLLLKLLYLLGICLYVSMSFTGTLQHLATSQSLSTVFVVYVCSVEKCWSIPLNTD